MAGKNRHERIEQHRQEAIASEQVDETATPDNVAVYEFARKLYLSMIRPDLIPRRISDTFGLTVRMGQKYVAKLKAEYAVHTEAEREVEIEQTLAELAQIRDEYNALLLEARAEGDYEAARAILDSRAKLAATRAKFRGLHAPERVEVSITALTDAEMLLQMRDLLKQLPAEERALLLPGAIDVEAVEVKEDTESHEEP